MTSGSITNQRRKQLLSGIYVAVMFYLSSQAALGLLLKGPGIDYTQSSTASSQVLWLVMYALGPIILLTDIRRLLICIESNIPLLLFSVWAGLSVAWSGAASQSLTRTAALLFSTGLGILIGTQLTSAAFIQYLEFALVLCVLSSALVAILLPEYGQRASSVRGVNWNGVFTTQGALGRISAITALLLVSQIIAGSRHRRLRLLLCIMSVYTLYRSDSRTAALSLMIALILISSVYLLRTITPRSIIIFTVSSVALLFLIPHVRSLYASFVDVVGRDAGLTGRERIWQLSLDAVSRHFWIGYGYGGFWRGFNGPSAAIWSDASLGYPPHAHNGYIEVLLNLGFIGLFLSALVLLTYQVRSMQALHRQLSSVSIFSFGFGAFFIVSNYAEVSLAAANTLYWIVFISILFLLTPHSPNRRRRRPTQYQPHKVPAPAAESISRPSLAQSQPRSVPGPTRHQSFQ